MPSLGPLRGTRSRLGWNPECALPPPAGWRRGRMMAEAMAFNRQTLEQAVRELGRRVHTGLKTIEIAIYADLRWSSWTAWFLLSHKGREAREGSQRRFPDP